MNLQLRRCTQATGTKAHKSQYHRQHLVLPVRSDVAAAAGKAQALIQQDVAVKVTATSFSSRQLQAAVDIQAPISVVWEALTDYDNLGKFIPSLAENRCIERRKQGCLLYQVGAQKLALGIKFSAAVTLEIKEYPKGIPSSMCASKGDFGRYFPIPSTPNSSSPASSSSSVYSSMDSSSNEADEATTTSGASDISFNLVTGDFQAFKGIWRMQPGGPDPSSTVLQYALFVRPHPWLPVKLIEDRISSEVVNNLQAVRQHTQRIYRNLQQSAQKSTQRHGQEDLGSVLQHSTFSSRSSSSSADELAGEVW